MRGFEWCYFNFEKAILEYVYFSISFIEKYEMEVFCFVGNEV